VSTPAVPTPPKKVNRINLEPATYRGAKTTLCAGCGHNAISERIIDAFYEMGVLPGQCARIQLGPRADAVGGDRRADGQQDDARYRRQW
jgi:hypothetical protein